MDSCPDHPGQDFKAYARDIVPPFGTWCHSGPSEFPLKINPNIGNQWIIDEANECFGFEDSWMLCDRDNMNDRCVYTHYRKASAKEIIERFKK